MATQWPVSGSRQFTASGRECGECQELFAEWNRASRLYAQKAVEFSLAIGAMNGESNLTLRAEVESAQKLASESHLSYRLHRSNCPIVMQRRQA